jgi:hypothetical protein
MNKRPDDPNKHGAIVTLDGSQLPAVIKKTKTRGRNSACSIGWPKKSTGSTTP